VRYPTLILSVAAVLAACAGGERPSTGDVPDQARDLTVPTLPTAAEPVASRVELEPPPAVQADPQSPRTVEVVAAVPSSTPVVFTDDLDLPPRPVSLDRTIPILGAGAGSVLSAGNTVTAFGPPVTLGDSSAVGQSPWPTVEPGDYPSFDRSTAGSGLVIRAGGEGHGACPRGRATAIDQTVSPTR